MSEFKELVCVNCPKSCNITVELEGKEIKNITGYTCPRGKAYAEKEFTMPTRILTSTVKVDDAEYRVIPVITSDEIPLKDMEEAMEEIRKVEIKAPVELGQVVIKDLLGLGVDVVTSRSMAKK